MMTGKITLYNNQLFRSHRFIKKILMKNRRAYLPLTLRIRPIASLSFSMEVAYESRIHPGA